MTLHDPRPRKRALKRAMKKVDHYRETTRQLRDLSAAKGRQRRIFATCGVEAVRDFASERPLAIVATYAPDGLVQSSTERYVASIKSAGYDVLVVVPTPSSEPVAVARTVASASGCFESVVVSENLSMDFGSWAAGISVVGDCLHDRPAVLLTNDSVTGPSQGISSLLATARASDNEVLGLTECFYYDWHLQSYWLLCDSAVVRSEPWRVFWDSIEFFENRENIIRRYEVGFSRMMFRGGVSCRALFPASSIMAVQQSGYRNDELGHHLIYGNPTIEHWEILIRDLNFPFIKRSLLRKGKNNDAIKSAPAETISTLPETWRDFLWSVPQ